MRAASKQRPDCGCGKVQADLRRALTPPHSSIKHRALDQPSFRRRPMKRRHEKQTAMTDQLALVDRDGMEE